MLSSFAGEVYPHPKVRAMGRAGNGHRRFPLLTLMEFPRTVPGQVGATQSQRAFATA